MEQQRDPQIPCADCGASFVFSAAEAAVFAERGLLPPKRCKDCRRARKERATREGGAPRGAAPGRGNGGPPRRYTGDVNEYRSPMADSFSGSFYGAPVPQARGNSAWQHAGEYRSPMAGKPTDGNVRIGLVGEPGRGSPNPSGALGRRFSKGQARPATAGGPPAPRAGSNGHAADKPQRRRPPAEMFSITCNACGAQAEVPFKPAADREVFCPSCYRARRKPGGSAEGA